MAVTAGFALPLFWSTDYTSGVFGVKSVDSTEPTPKSLGPAAHSARLDKIAESAVAGKPQAANPKEKSGLDNDLEYRPPQLPDLPDTAAMVRRLALGTLFVLGLCIASLWLGKSLLRFRPVGLGGNSKLRIASSLPLGNRCGIYLIETEGRQLVAGVDRTGLKALVPLMESFESAMSGLRSEVAIPPGQPEPVIMPLNK